MGFPKENDVQTAFFFLWFCPISISVYRMVLVPQMQGLQPLQFPRPEDAAEAAGSPQATILVQKIDEKMKQTDAWSVNPCCERSSELVRIITVYDTVLFKNWHNSLWLWFLGSPFICSLNLAVFFHALWESEIWCGSVLTTKWLEPFVEAARCCFRCQPHLNPRYSCTLEFLNKKKVRGRIRVVHYCPLLSSLLSLCSRLSVTSTESTHRFNGPFRQPLDVFLSWHLVSPFELLGLGFLDLHCHHENGCAPQFIIFFWCPLCFYSIWVHFCVTTSMLCGSRFRISPPWDRGRFSHSRDATRVGFSLWTLHHAAGGALEGHGGSLGSGHHVAMENQWTCMNMSIGTYCGTEEYHGISHFYVWMPKDIPSGNLT